MKAIESRSPMDQCLRFRVLDDNAWRAGRAVNVSSSGILFSSAQPLEIGTVLEVDFHSNELKTSLGPRRGIVVRRVLMRWPDLNPLVAIRFLEEEPLN
jgi:hypothetical protein